MYREVQLDFTPEIEEFYMLFERCYKVAVLIVGLSYPAETVLSTKITRNRIVLPFKDSPTKPLGRLGEASKGIRKDRK